MSTNVNQETKTQTMAPVQEAKKTKSVQDKTQFNGSIIPNAPIGFQKAEPKKPEVKAESRRPEPCFLLNYPVSYDKDTKKMAYGHLYRVNGLYGYTTIDKIGTDYERVQLIRFDKNKPNGMVVVTKACARVISDADRRELIEKIRKQAFECADKELRNDSLFYKFMCNGNLYENDFSKEFGDFKFEDDTDDDILDDLDLEFFDNLPDIKID